MVWVRVWVRAEAHVEAVLSLARPRAVLVLVRGRTTASAAASRVHDGGRGGHEGGMWVQAAAAQPAAQLARPPVGHRAPALHVHQHALAVDLAPVAHLVRVWRAPPASESVSG
jgi:hypothetical protein